LASSSSSFSFSIFARSPGPPTDESMAGCLDEC
jgi:hypothetical protein